MTKPQTVSLDHLAERYDVFFVDQFGVLRDDIGPYDGAIDTLSKLASAGKRIVILSNSGRSGKYNAERLAKLGFLPDSFQFFVTSGDVAFSVLSRLGSPIRTGQYCLTISSGGDSNLADRLGLRSTDMAAKADLVIISGSEAESTSMEQYRSMLRPAAERGIPCYCTNPDIHKLHDGSTVPGAGSIAKLYEVMGGTVTWLGKPYADIYEEAISLAAVTDRRQIICIGDSIEHDILGARAAGLDSVLVRTGILAKANDEELADLFESVRAQATYLMQRFSY